MSRQNVPRLYVQAIFALAAALALTTAACGKQDGGGGVTPANTKTAPPVTNTSTVGAVAGTAAPEKKDKTAEADKLKSTSASGLGTLFEKRGEGGTGDIVPEPDGNEVEKPISTATEVEPLPELTTESVVYYDPNGATPDQIFARKEAIDRNGAFIGELVRSDIVSSNGESIYYTGAGKDNLREQLYTLVNERAARQHPIIQAGDKELAQTIQLASFNIDWSSRRAELQFKFERMGSYGKVTIQKFTLQGPLDNLTRFKVGTLTKAPFVQAEVACMDISGGCQTVHIRAQDNSTGNIRTAHLIARHTNATLYIEGNAPGVSKNAEYDRLMSILLNTVTHPRGQNVVEKLTLTTSETIGGASNFTTTMKIRLQDVYGRTGGDTVELTGPLAKPRGNDNPNVAVNVSPALTVINGEIVPTTAIGTEGRIVDVIRDTRLVKNDGRGNLQLDLTVRTAAIGAQEDRIRLTISRIHTPTTAVRIPMQ